MNAFRAQHGHLAIVAAAPSLDALPPVEAHAPHRLIAGGEMSVATLGAEMAAEQADSMLGFVERAAAQGIGSLPEYQQLQRTADRLREAVRKADAALGRLDAKHAGGRL